jgi:hypothetical protein
MDKKNLNRYLDITEETLDILIKIYHTYGNIEKKLILLLIMNFLTSDPFHFSHNFSHSLI